ncbi:MAG: phosphoribosylglycinamide formyltransferase [Alkalispirochaetaceae bacterium]
MAGITVLVSGEGTTLQNLIDASSEGRLRSEILAVIADRNARALDRARAAGIPTHLILRKEHGEALSDRIFEAIPDGTELLVLAGFLSILTGSILERFKERIINIHPALLPKFGGPGMYGIRVHRAVISKGERESGCTVHYVDEGTDTGPILLQRKLKVLPNESPEELRNRVAVLEKSAVVEGVNMALERLP